MWVEKMDAGVIAMMCAAGSGAALYLESTLEFAQQIESQYADVIGKMVQSYNRMTARKNGQKDLF